jgi:hypothetical protein
MRSIVEVATHDTAGLLRFVCQREQCFLCRLKIERATIVNVLREFVENVRRDARLAVSPLAHRVLVDVQQRCYRRDVLFAEQDAAGAVEEFGGGHVLTDLQSQKNPSAVAPIFLLPEPRS